MLSKEIWVFVQYRQQGLSPATSGLLGEARKLAKNLNGTACACLLGSDLAQYFPLLADGGAQKTYFSEHEILAQYALDTYARVLQGFIARYEPLLLIFDASGAGGELAAKIALKLRLPCITEVKRIDVAGDHLVISKSCYQDKIYKNVGFRPDKTVILTILPEDTDSTEDKVAPKMELITAETHLEPGESRSRCIDFLKGDPQKISLEESDLIVAGGKGIGEDMTGLAELADILGASVGGTRPLVDEGRIPFQRQIGITGKTVSPRLLFALGISGAREFSAGTEKAKMTIAVNTDKKAPIFKNADLRVNADAQAIIPALINRLRQKKEHDQ